MLLVSRTVAWLTLAWLVDALGTQAPRGTRSSRGVPSPRVCLAGGAHIAGQTGGWGEVPKGGTLYCKTRVESRTPKGERDKQGGGQARKKSFHPEGQGLLGSSLGFARPDEASLTWRELANASV